MAWTNGTQRTGTSQWKKLRARAREALEYACQENDDTNNCDGPLELDHIQNFKGGGMDDLSNLQWLCRRHHMLKTQREAALARRQRLARGRYPSQAHPGLI